MRGKYIVIATLLVLFLSSFLPVLSIAVRIEGGHEEQLEEDLPEMEMIDGGLELLVRDISDRDIQDLISKEGVMDGERGPAPTVNGMGTGLTPPTHEGWDIIQQETMLVEKVSNIFPTALNTSRDHSTSIHFPPIGNQGSEGSCVSWSIGYYTKTFQEAKEHGWNLSGASYTGSWPGYPTPSYQNRIMSPEFLYHQVNNGANGGSYYHDNINVCKRTGISSWKNMPYSHSDRTSWPSEDAWREAPKYRTKDTTYYMYVNTDTRITNLKTWIDGGNLATISIDAGKYSSLSSHTDGDLWTNATNCVQNRNHANTIVGYDDNFGNYSEDGVNRTGAFKVANSWGKSWSGDSDGDGMFWISYRAMRNKVDYVYMMTDRIGYNPEIISVFNISHNYRNDCQITLGIGNSSSPTASKRFDDYTYRGGNYPYPNNLMVLDITDFSSSVSNYYGQNFFLRVTDGGQSTTGSIQHFSVEYYDDFLNGSREMSATSKDPVVSTIQGSSVHAEVILKDSEYPKLVIDNTPGNATTGDALNFSAEITDNTAVYGVWLEYRVGSGPSFNVSCSRGSGNTWYYNTTAPDSLGSIHYTYHFNDTSDYWNKTDQKVITIRDNDLPVFVTTMLPIKVTTGDEATFTVNATDNIGLSSITMEHWIDDEAHTNSTMTASGQNLYDLTVTMPSSDSTFYFIISAMDTSSNWNTTGALQYFVEDNDRPFFIMDITPGSGTTGDDLTFSIEIGDNVQTHTAWVDFWYEGGPHTNISMNMMGEGVFDRTIALEHQLSDLHYIFHANDTSNNWNASSEGSVNISDNDLPSFGTDLSDMEAFTGDSFHFEIAVTDNIGMVDGEAYLRYSIAGTHWDNLTLNRVGIDAWSTDIILPLNETGTMSYHFIAVDGSGNWNTTDEFHRTIIDNDEPVMMEDLSDPAGHTGELFLFEINASDNIGISIVTVEFWFGNGTHTNKSLIKDDGTIWTGNITIPVDSLDELNYIVWISDLSDLYFMADTVNITIEDTIDPVFDDHPDDLSPTTGDILNIYVMVSDNIGMLNVEMHYRIGEEEPVSVYMEHMVMGSYRANISIPHLLSDLNISFRAIDLYNNSMITKWMVFSILDNDAPILRTFENLTAEPGETISLNSSGCFDNIGVEHYNWSVVGPENMFFNTSEIEFEFDEPGSYMVYLNVSDGSGNQNLTFFMIEVVETTVPSLEFEIELLDDNVTLFENLSMRLVLRNNGNVNMTITFDIESDLEDGFEEFEPLDMTLTPGMDLNYTLDIPAMAFPVGEHFIIMTVTNSTSNISITRTIEFTIWDDDIASDDDDDDIIVDDDDDDDIVVDDDDDDDVIVDDDDDDPVDDDGGEKDGVDQVAEWIRDNPLIFFGAVAGLLAILLLLLFIGRRKKEEPGEPDEVSKDQVEEDRNEWDEE